MPLLTACTTDEQVTVTATPVTATGRPAQIDGALVVTVTSGNGTFVQLPATPLVVTLVSGDTAGDTVYSIVADSDLGAGVVQLSDTATLTVTSATAASFGLTAGAPEPKP
jgi:hypothetical protein